MIANRRGKIKLNARDCIGRINWPSSLKKSNTSISYTHIFPNSLYIFYFHFPLYNFFDFFSIYDQKPHCILELKTEV